MMLAGPVLKTAPVTFSYEPTLAACTGAVMVQLPFAGITPPESLSDVGLLTAEPAPHVVLTVPA
ncbi:MAG TPA: hypothetical protein VEO74_08400, partial [Thermoanaerobaculia bacterium]|nr:hypothetical protein [Thermoanaerobaculia bacterium]